MTFDPKDRVEWNVKARTGKDRQRPQSVRRVQCAKCGRVFHSSVRAFCLSCRPPIRY